MSESKVSYTKVKEGKAKDAPTYHTFDSVEVLKILDSNEKSGLSNFEANKRLNEYGPNELAKKEKESIWEKIKEQFEDLLVRLLLLAAVISFVVAQFEKTQEEHAVPSWVEPLVIFSILVLNAVVGIYQDYDAEKALDALKELQSNEALVLRESEWIKIKARELVPGDIVQITIGDKIPADMRVIEIKTTTLRIDQAILTGESSDVTKHTETIDNPAAVITEKTNIVFSATLVTSGTAIAVVIGTGMNTEIGVIQSEVDDAKKESDEEDTPLKKRLNEFGNLLAKCVSGICVIIWLVNFRNFSDPVHGGLIMGCLYYFKISIALAVAAIPEGLPAVITTCLALGTRRMAKENAIVRTLPSVETLGCTTVICSDKTGTLTTNEMVVKEMLLYGSNAREFVQSSISGVSYNPEGEISNMTKGDILRYKNLKYAAECMSINNDSKLLKKNNRVTRAGLPTEAALKVLVEKMKKYDETVFQEEDDIEIYNNHLAKSYKKLALLEFTRDRKAMSVLTKDHSTQKNLMFIKGAPDYLIKQARQAILRNGELVTLTEDDKRELIKKVNSLAEKGLRTLALAMKQDCDELSYYEGPQSKFHKDLEDPLNYSKFEQNPIIIGIVAMQDPPRPEVAESIKQCRRAGISVIMITGDIKETAQAIGKEIGIVTQEQYKDRSFTGAEFEAINPQQRKEILQKCIDEHSGLIFARTEPRHKRFLVKELKELNQIVAMTGDGVNDAPALQQANIGIAMGISGTEVAKEASAMVLADDNFATIVKAVEEGRAIFANMKGFIRYMISSNIGEVVSIFLSSVLGIPDGFNSIQLLWVNLVTDGLPATALSFNPPDPHIMKKAPRKHDEPIINSWVFFRYLVIGSYVGFATVGIFVYWYTSYDWAGDSHPLVSFSQLADWGECSGWEGFAVASFGKYDFSKNPCAFFTSGKQKASTLSLSVLVVIEMFNALNALSEDSSLLTVGFWVNPWLLIAISMSIILHCMILYVPFFEAIFNTVPLSFNDWILVLRFSFPVLLVDEVLKFVSRKKNAAELLEGKKNN